VASPLTRLTWAAWLAGVPPAVPGLEQGQLGARVRAFAAGEDPHALWPGGQLVPARTFAQQPGQLGNVRFLDQAPRMAAAAVRAGLIGAALPDLTAVIDRDLPAHGAVHTG